MNYGYFEKDKYGLLYLIFFKKKRNYFIEIFFRNFLSSSSYFYLRYEIAGALAGWGARKSRTIKVGFRTEVNANKMSLLRIYNYELGLAQTLADSSSGGAFFMRRVILHYRSLFSQQPRNRFDNHWRNMIFFVFFSRQLASFLTVH